MTDTATKPAEPNKSSLMKKIFWVIGIILGLLGIDHYTTNVISGGTVTVTDSTIVVTTVDTTTIKEVSPEVVVPAIDTTKKVTADTTKKAVEVKK